MSRLYLPRYMLEHCLSGAEESHYLDFIRYTMSEQESRDHLNPNPNP